ncbi:PA0069 family radical SAM protein [soil metagenome]
MLADRSISSINTPRGRGTGLALTNRFESVAISIDGEYVDHALAAEVAERNAERAAGLHEGEQDGRAPVTLQDILDEETKVTTRVFVDQTKSVIVRVDSPDLGMQWSLNPYRGCEHGCIYCYARPGHEYLGLNCGIDFETKVFAKPNAPELLRRELAKPGWKAESISVSGVTDCYQPIERTLRITRACMEVMLACRQPVTIVTKNHLVTRDIDLFREFARWNGVRVALSLTSLDADLARKMEPRASTPRDRLRAMRELADAGVPVTVMTAPLIPALNDRELPALLEAAAAHGATTAGYTFVRLPWQIKELFLEWLQRHYPQRAAHVESLIRQSRGGKLYKADFGTRMKGAGIFAEQLGQTFKVFTKRYGLNTGARVPLNSALFRAPSLDGQMGLF